MAIKTSPPTAWGPRLRLKQSLDEIFAEKLPGVIDCVESKVFGIGMEAFTVGSSEFYISYAASHPGVYDLLDNGHYHPTEVVSDKIPSLLAFFDKVPLHVTRGVRWDSDHVVLYEDELKEIAKEIVRNKATDRVLIGFISLTLPLTALPPGWWAHAAWKKPCCLRCSSLGTS